MIRNTLLGVALATASTLALAQSGTSTTGAGVTGNPTPNGVQGSGAVTTPIGTVSGSVTGTTGISGNPTPAPGTTNPVRNMGFFSLDTNTDGSLSREELRADALLATRFSQLDTNSDGKLSENEFAASAATTGGGAGAAGSSTPNTMSPQSPTPRDRLNSSPSAADRLGGTTNTTPGTTPTPTSPPGG